MLSSLPPELLHQIIESTVPQSFHSTTYRDRQRTLSSLCLVSKYVRSIAQPLLFEIVWMRSRKTVRELESACMSIGTNNGASSGKVKGKVLVIGDSEQDTDSSLSEEDVYGILSTLASSLESLSWSAKPNTTLNASYLSDLTRLSKLHLSFHRGDWQNLQRLPWTNLQSLTLFSVGSSILTALLDPAVVPNLRHFGLVTAQVQAVTDLATSQFYQLAPQLQTLSFDMKLWRMFDSDYRSLLRGRTLVDCHLEDLGYATQDEAQAVHVRMYSPAENGEVLGWASRLKRSLDEFATSVEQNPSLPLQCLYLDDSLRLPSTLSPDIVEAITRAVKITQQHGIDLGFETAPDDFSIDPCISPEFRRRQRNLTKQEV